MVDIDESEQEKTQQYFSTIIKWYWSIANKASGPDGPLALLTSRFSKYLSTSFRWILTALILGPNGDNWGRHLPLLPRREYSAKILANKFAFWLALCAMGPSGLCRGGSEERQNFFSTDLARLQKALLPEGKEANLSPIRPVSSKRAFLIAILQDFAAA